MMRLDESYISVQAIDRAYDEDTLVDLVSDYIVFGGDVEDIYEAVKSSSIVSTEDIDKAVKYLKDNKLIGESCCGCEEEENYYGEDGDDLSDFRDIITGGADYIREDVDDSIDIDIRTVGDLLSGAIDNMSSEQLDSEIKLFKKIAKTLGVKDYDDTVVVLDDGEYNPEYMLSDGVELKIAGRSVKYYESANMISELLNGNYFFYFGNEGDAKRYFATANKFLNSDELSKDVFGYYEEYEDKDSGCYDDNGNYVPDECEYRPQTIEEALNLLDKRTGNKFDLLNMFLEGRLDNNGTNKLVEMINSNADITTIYKHLNEAGGEYIDEEKSFKDTIMDRIRNGVNGNVSMRFYDPIAKKHIEKWLDFNNFDFEVDAETITVYITNAESTSDLKVKEAKRIKNNLLECIKVLDNFIDGKLVSDESIEAVFNQLSNAAYDCRDYLLRG